LGLLLVCAVPMFWVGLVGLVALYLGPTVLYVARRNEAVPPERRVLTGRHLRLLANRYLRLGLKVPAGEGGEKPIPIRFIGKSAGGRGADPGRVARAEGSRGYRAALEMV